MSAHVDPSRAEALAALVASVEVSADRGMRLLIDSEGLQQAVYLYRPVFDRDGSTIVDLEIAMVNEAARHVLLSEHIVEGVRVTEVFIDVQAALDAANEAWRGERPEPYRIERRGVHHGRPTTMRYEVATMRAGDHIVQVSVDRTIIEQLATADQRFRLMAEASIDGLMLLERTGDPGDEVYVLSYANPRALVAEPTLRVGEPLPGRIHDVVVDAVAELAEVTPVRRYLQREVLARRVSLEATFTDVGDDQVMMSVRELTSRESARAELERSDRVLRAIGEGAFGTIAVFEPQFQRGELAELTLLWSAAGHGQSTGHRPPLDPTSVLSASDLLQMARAMLRDDQLTRSGWVPVVGPDAEERSVEFTLVLAGDRFVLEFVERTEELAARTQLAMVTATAEAQRAFLSRVSHEMRSPLNVIHGYTQLLGELRLMEPASAHLTHIQQGVNRMVQIVDDLLLLGQLEQGLVRVDEQLTSVAELADEVLATVAGARWWRPDALVRHESRSDMTVVTDRSRFVSAAVLLVEASLAVEDGTPMEIGEFSRGARAGIQLVAPTVSPVVRELWAPFVQSHTIPGSGLGMAVARGMVRTLDVLVELRPAVDDDVHSRLVLSLPSAV